MAARPGASAWLMRWHRRVGLVAGVLVAIAALTGLLINHADRLSLTHRQVSTGWLLRLYGIQPARLLAAFPAGAAWLSQWDARLYLDARALDGPPVEQLLGVFPAGDAWLAIDRRRALLLARDGALIDELRYPDGFVAERAAGAGAAGPILVEGGDRRLQTDAAAAAFVAVDARQPHGAAPLAWASAQPLPPALRESIGRQPDGRGISVERLLLDIHAGRWLGPAGTWLMDAAALALLALAGSGAYASWRRRGAGRF